MPQLLPSEHVKNILVTDGYQFGNGPGDWRLYIGKMPLEPDRVITIYDAGGLAPNPRWLLNYPQVQVRARGSQSDYQLSGQKVFEVRERLVGKESFTAPSGDRIVSITGMGDVSFTGWDDASRPSWVFNLSMITEPTPSTTPTNREPL